jgi:cell division protein YceG involved in septum cleavage
MVRKQTKMKKMNVVVLVLVTLLVLAVGYIGYDKYIIWKQQRDLSNFQIGAQYGYEQAITQLYQQVQTCQQVPIFYNNQTLNIISVECLQQAG